MFDFVHTFLEVISSINPLLLIGIAFVAVVLETSILIGLVVPGDAVIIVASLGVKNFGEYLLLLIAVIFGSFVGETCGFLLGKFFGKSLRKIKFKNLKFDRANSLIQQHEWKALLISRFTPVLHSVVPVAAGIAGLKYKKFIFWTMISCTLWAVLYVTFGFLAVSNYRELSGKLHYAALIFFAILVGFVTLITVIKKFAKKYSDNKDSAIQNNSLHFAAIWENRMHELLRKWARKRKRVEIINPVMGYGSEEWIRVLGRVLMVNPKSAKKNKDIRGWRSFFSIPVPGVLVKARICKCKNYAPTIGQSIGTQNASMDDSFCTCNPVEYFFRADRGGVIDAKVPVKLSPGMHTVYLATPRSGSFRCQIAIVSKRVKIGFVSDIDDTIVVTRLPRVLVAAWNTFVVNERARHPVSGMNVLFELLARANPGAPFIYLSTGAWNTAAALERFMTRNIYPQGPLLLTDWGPTHDRWFRNGNQHKRENIERLISEFPRIKWVLIGDSGQHDEGIYTEFALRYPKNVELILIRRLFAFEAFFIGRFLRRKQKKSTLKIVRYGHDGSDMLNEIRMLPKSNFTIRI
ncbi:phosphatase domain-containing protein [Tropheryma whipplei]|uniref:phosphatase domain-containing protein n=1 Tax=Tropheryma whipplei TaxID=2039 RepID=UPI00056FA1BF|nr:phosphatase domain-containing protein [Tropheryma whipplei]